MASVSPSVCDKCIWRASRLPSNKGLPIKTAQLDSAIYFQHKQCIEILLQIGVDLTVGYALCEAISRGDAKHAKLLLEAGSSPDQVSRSGFTALMLAAKQERCYFVYLLLKKGAQVDLTSNKTRYCRLKGGWTPLMFAVNTYSNDCMFLLLDKGANVNARSHRGESALLIAARCCQKQKVRLLLEAGANVNLSDMRGRTALMRVSSSHLPGAGKILKYLLAAGADVNKRALFSGETSIMIATRSSALKKITELTNLPETDVNSKNNKGETALFIAVKSCDRDTMNVLLRSGADVNAQNVHGETTLFMAARAGCIGCIKMLLRANIRINIFSTKTFNAVQFARVNRCSSKEAMFILYVAGELDFDEGKLHENNTSLPEALPKLKQGSSNRDFVRSLKTQCRSVIRKNMLLECQNTHLFGRIPQLGLPSLLAEYLLYNRSLELEDSEFVDISQYDSDSYCYESDTSSSDEEQEDFNSTDEPDYKMAIDSESDD